MKKNLSFIVSTVLFIVSVKVLADVVSKSNFNGIWPLTVKEGTLLCDNNAVTFTTTDGEVYAVNGIAGNKGAQPIDPIWANNPTSPGTKLNIRDLVEKGLSLCSNATSNKTVPAATPPQATTGKGSLKSAGFDCAKASTKVEKFICSNALLSDADGRLATVYSTQRNALPVAEAKQLQQAQRQWLKVRNQRLLKCGGNIDCAIGVYEKRIAEIQKSRQSGQNPVTPSQTDNAPKNWYEGGTLHRGQGKDWRTATDSNRLATSADIVAKMNTTGKLTFTVQGIDELKPYAIELSTCLTEFLKDKLTDTQPVADSAIMCMIAMKWFK